MEAEAAVLDKLWLSYMDTRNKKYLIEILIFVNQDPKEYFVKHDGKDLILSKGMAVASGINSLEQNRRRDPKIDATIKQIITKNPNLDYRAKILKEKGKISGFGFFITY